MAHEHRFISPFPGKTLERCRDCGMWLIHTEYKVVWLPPLEELRSQRLFRRPAELFLFPSRT